MAYKLRSPIAINLQTIKLMIFRHRHITHMLIRTDGRNGREWGRVCESVKVIRAIQNDLTFKDMAKHNKNDSFMLSITLGRHSSSPDPSSDQWNYNFVLFARLLPFGWNDDNGTACHSMINVRLWLFKFIVQWSTVSVHCTQPMDEW